MGASLQEAERQIPQSGPATIVLLSDGEDTCPDTNPSDTARSIKQRHPEVTINTVGFKTDNAQLRDIADAGGGIFLTADNIDQLESRLTVARKANSRTRLSSAGLYGVSIGMTIDVIRGRSSDFPQLRSGRKDGGRVIVSWRDCDWIFLADGTLVAIKPKKAATIDGIRAGRSLSDAVSKYGQPIAVEPDGSASGGKGKSSGRYVAYFDADDGLTWKVTFTSDDGGKSGPIGGMHCYDFDLVAENGEPYGGWIRDNNVVALFAGSEEPRRSVFVTERGFASGDDAGRALQLYPDLQGMEEKYLRGGKSLYCGAAKVLICLASG